MTIASALMMAAVLFPAAAHDDNVEWNGVSHIDRLDRSPICPVDGESFTVSFQTFDFDITSARVAVDTGTVTWVTAAYSHDRGGYDVWTADVPSSSPAGSLEYYIELTDGTETDYLGPAGMSSTPPASGWEIDFASLSHAPLGATLVSGNDAVFKVWGLGATTATVAGEFNGWNPSSLPMTKTDDYFTRRANNVDLGDMYKYVFDGSVWKPDARARGLNPTDNYNSHVYDPGSFPWTDGDFVPPPFEEVIIYQLHVGTFSGRGDGGQNPGTYRNVVDLHLDHLVDLGVNVVQVMPITEFPWDWSGGYNPVTAWAPEWRLGDPDDLKYMVDKLHDAGIAVTLDIVWNHFSGSDNYLWNYTGDQIYFDSPAFGTPWGDQADFDNEEVRDYFADSSLHWLDEMHFDGFRMDATDFMHPPNGQPSGWSLMQRFNDEMDQRASDKISVAEQLPDNSYFTRPTADGGAGFDSQYHDRHKYALRNAIFGAATGSANMSELRQTILGRMNDSGSHTITDTIDGVAQTTTQLVKYMELHDEAWPESGGQRMAVTIDTTPPHDDEFARGRTLVGHAVNFFSPGIPAFLMGAEFLEDTPFGAGAPGTPESRLDWTKPTTYADYLLAFKDMIRIRKENAGFRSNAGYESRHLNDSADVLTIHRWDGSGNDLMVVISLGNSDQFNYQIGLPQPGTWYELFNSQASIYGGSGLGNGGSISTIESPRDGYAQSAFITIPKMSATVFRFNEPPTVWDSPDVDGDGDVDLVDMHLLAQCFGTGFDCAVDADLDNDGDVDTGDWEVMYGQVTGPQ